MERTETEKKLGKPAGGVGKQYEIGEDRGCSPTHLTPASPPPENMCVHTPMLCICVWVVVVVICGPAVLKDKLRREGCLGIPSMGLIGAPKSAGTLFQVSLKRFAELIRNRQERGGRTRQLKRQKKMRGRSRGGREKEGERERRNKGERKGRRERKKE
ncbi:hypothetical protein L345_14814, partial [Ophiophagus hannah]